MPALLLLLIFLSAICEAGISEQTKLDDRSKPLKKRMQYRMYCHSGADASKQAQHEQSSISLGTYFYSDEEKNTVSTSNKNKVEASGAIDVTAIIIKESTEKDYKRSSESESLVNAISYAYNNHKESTSTSNYTINTHNDGSSSYNDGNEIKHITPISSVLDEHNGETSTTLTAVSVKERNLPSETTTFNCKQDSNSNDGNGTNGVSVTCIEQNNFEKSYQCKISSECFTQVSNLRHHERARTGETPYQCEICGKSFSRKGGLVKHQRIHAGVKPYPCKSCGKCFTQSSTLRNHRRIHTGEKPYPCRHCSKCFAQNSTRNHHEKLHERKNTSTGVD